jgi:hypothetical protein
MQAAYLLMTYTPLPPPLSEVSCGFCAYQGKGATDKLYRFYVIIYIIYIYMYTYY